MVGIGLENRDTLKGVTPFDSTVLRHLIPRRCNGCTLR
jgi:hypothetical protein